MNFTPAVSKPSLPEAFVSVRVPDGSASGWRRLLAFTGPGLLVAGGSQFGYLRLSVVALSNGLAMLRQASRAEAGDRQRPGAASAPRAN